VQHCGIHPLFLFKQEKKIRSPFHYGCVRFKQGYSVWGQREIAILAGADIDNAGRSVFKNASSSAESGVCPYSPAQGFESFFFRFETLPSVWITMS
jgi:hypothetical protein